MSWYHFGNCEECRADGACFGHQKDLPTRSQLLSVWAASFGDEPRYVGGPLDGKARYRSFTELAKGDDESLSEKEVEYFESPGRRHLFHISLIAHPRRWEKMLKVFHEREAKRIAESRERHLREKAEKEAAKAPKKSRRRVSPLREQQA